LEVGDYSFWCIFCPVDQIPTIRNDETRPRRIHEAYSSKIKIDWRQSLLIDLLIECFLSYREFKSGDVYKANLQGRMYTININNGV
jgi:hypothetical protein